MGHPLGQTGHSLVSCPVCPVCGRRTTGTNVPNVPNVQTAPLLGLWCPICLKPNRAMADTCPVSHSVHAETRMQVHPCPASLCERGYGPPGLRCR